MKKRFGEEQIIGFLKEAEAGVPVMELCRKYGFSDASFYLWRSKYGAQVPSDRRRCDARGDRGDRRALRRRRASDTDSRWDLLAARTSRRDTHRQRPGVLRQVNVDLGTSQRCGAPADRARQAQPVWLVAIYVLKARHLPGFPASTSILQHIISAAD